MPQHLLPAIEINPAETPVASVIWLHGLGADGSDFAGIVPQLGIKADLPIRFVFPHAPQRPVTLNGGMVMPAWFDITGLGLEARNDEAGILQAEKSIHAQIEREKELGLPANKIIIAGFSQGGAVALYSGLRYPEKLAGIIGLSTYLPLRNDLSPEKHPANKDVPLFIGHGTDDTLVQFSWGDLTRQRLQELNYPAEWHTYPIGHSVCLEEIRDIGKWLQEILTK